MFTSIVTEVKGDNETTSWMLSRSFTPHIFRVNVKNKAIVTLILPLHVVK